jgi:type IV pilus assembly protein PilC
MKKFTYEAKDTTSGKRVKSTVQAESEHAAAKLLIEQGFVPLEIKENNENASLRDKLTGRITTKDKIVFSRQLATLIGAGLPLSQSLRTVSEQTENKRFRGIVDEIIADIEGGKSLSDSFAKHPDVFDKVFLALIQAGEASGTLDDALKRIAAQQEKDAAVMSKIKGALTYPVIVLFVIFGVMAFMLFTVVPQVEKLYQDLRKELPFLTQAMVSIADFMAHFWWLVIIILGIVGYFTMQYLKTEAGIKFKDTLKLNVPLFGIMFRKLYMARLARTGQTLLSTGVPMLDMLRITSGAVNNTIIGKSIDRAAEKVKGGKALSTSIQPEEYILPLLPQMIKIGEQSGKMDEMLGKTAQVYEEELDEEIRTISTAIEPVLMVVLAIVAGGMVGAILFPIYSLVNGINV